MKTVVLGKEKETKRNQQPPVTRPNVTESCMFVDEDGKPFGFYPAWKSMHGVEEITPTKTGGYRNSLVLYHLDISYDTKSGEESILSATKDASVSN